MTNHELSRAIELVEHGQHEQAQTILQSLIQADPHDLTAWSWYVQNAITPEKRLEGLELCLQSNPGNEQVIEGIRILRNELPSKNALSESFAWYNIWWMALTQPSFRAYSAILNDPLANATRASWWVFSATVVVKLLSLLTIFVTVENLQALAAGQKSLWLGLVIAVASLPFAGSGSVLAMLVGSFFANWFAKRFGGTGTFGSTFYLTAAYVAPISFISGILSMMPAVFFLFVPIGLYVFWLQVVVIRAAHHLSGMRAGMAVLIPTLLAVGVMYLFQIVANLIANIG